MKDQTKLEHKKEKRNQKIKVKQRQEEAEKKSESSGKKQKQHRDMPTLYISLYSRITYTWKKWIREKELR